MEYTKEDIDRWIACAGLTEELSIFDSAIEIDVGYSGAELCAKLPEVEGADFYNTIGYRVLMKLLDVAQDESNKFNSGEL